jgi:2-methylcitrate dehydratase PrpD
MVTEKIANFISETDYRKIPREAFEIAKRAVLDYMGVAIAGSNETGVKIICEMVEQMGATPEAGIICKGLGSSADLAAWANGTMGHALDYDDTVATSAHYNMHPSVGILPAVLALGEKYQVSGNIVLTAYIVGMEVMYRLGPILVEIGTKLGWHSTGTLGTLAAAAASSNLLKLSTSKTAIALGVAGSLAGGMGRNGGTMTKPMHAGNAARNGVVAASLAKNGFTGSADILDGEASFCKMFTAGVGGEPQDTVLDLGNNWQIVSTGIGFKPYPSCRATHSCIDATLRLREELGIRHEHVTGVICRVSRTLDQFWILHHPATGYQGKFSFEYCVATALVRGRVSLNDFSESAFNDTSVRNFLPRVKVEFTDDQETGIYLAQEVVIKLQDGTVQSCKVDSPRGEPENPMTDEELYAKFRDCSERVLKAKDVEETIERTMHLEELQAVTELVDGVLKR